MAKRPGKKPRKEYITGVTAGIVSKLTVTYDPSDETIRIPELDPESLTVSRSYKRASGEEKVTTAIKPTRENAAFDIWQELKASYDYLLAVDTNTSEKDGTRISVTVAYVTPKRLSEMHSEVPYVPLCGYVIVNVNRCVNPEVMGWHFILRNHVGRSGHTAKVGLIVDSELGRLPDINKRAIPYYEDKYLPPNVTLLYASDATADQLPNQMIRFCDRAATAAMKKVLANTEQIKGLCSDEPNCDGYAWFRTKRD